ETSAEFGLNVGQGPLVVGLLLVCHRRSPSACLLATTLASLPDPPLLSLRACTTVGNIAAHRPVVGSGRRSSRKCVGGCRSGCPFRSSASLGCIAGPKKCPIGHFMVVLYHTFGLYATPWYNLRLKL